MTAPDPSGTAGGEERASTFIPNPPLTRLPESVRSVFRAAPSSAVVDTLLNHADAVIAQRDALLDVAEAAQALHNSPIAHRGPDSPDGRLMAALERLEAL